MSENYVIKVDKLRGYQNTLKGEHTNFTNGVRNPFSRGYFYDCSDCCSDCRRVCVWTT